MKKILVACLLLIGCDRYTNHRYILYSVYGSGWIKSTGEVKCDSFVMKSKTECIYWVDGIKGNIIADKIIAVSH